MNKPIVVVSTIVVLLIAGYFVLNSISNNNQLNNNFSKAHSIYKESCKITNNQTPVNIYQNSNLNFTFSFPQETIVCERDNGNHLEITVWNKTDFDKEIPSLGPLAILAINNDAIDDIGYMVEKQETGIVGGEPATIEYAHPPSCKDFSSSCPRFIVYKFSHKDNNYRLEEKIQDGGSLVGGLIDTFSFTE